MSKYERNKWLFDILSTGNNESEQQVGNIVLLLIEIIRGYEGGLY